MGIAGQLFVKDTFSNAVITEKWERLLNEVLSSAVPNYATPAISGKYPLHRLRVANSRLRWPRLHAGLSFVDRVRGVFLKRC